MLFRNKNRESFKKGELLEAIMSAEQKSLRLEKRFASRSASDADENDRLALSCRQCANTLDECAGLVSQMLPPRDKRKAKLFEDNSKKLLRELNEVLQECENFDYPIKNGTLEKLVNELKASVWDITTI